MDQVTQQNAALVEEAAAAAQSMQEQAGSLVQTVSVFRLAARAQGLPSASPAAADKQETGRPLRRAHLQNRYPNR
jgi:methyl-accepting chemotaxis protein